MVISYNNLPLMVITHDLNEHLSNNLEQDLSTMQLVISSRQIIVDFIHINRKIETYNNLPPDYLRAG